MNLRSIVNGIARHRVISALFILLILPVLTPYNALAVNILIFGLFAVGFNLVYGYTGMLSFGHASFFGVGSYLTGIAMVHFGMNWIPAIFVGVAASLIAGLLVGYLAVRTRGIYFSMVTLALGQVIYYIFYKAERWTGGENGLTGIKAQAIHISGLSIDFLNPLTKYYIFFLFIAVTLWLVSRILASPFGSVIESIRENENRAVACGYDVARSKLMIFVISAGVCGLAGALRALHLSVVPVDSLNYLQSGQVLMMSLLGGVGSFFGPFAGAAVFLYLEEFATNVTKYWMGVVGILFIVLILFFPRGILGSLVHQLKRRGMLQGEHE
jgi:branched-chain amino acid transport system permease protein